jgi:hypothetical protein
MNRNASSATTLAHFLAPYRRAIALRNKHQRGGPFAPEAPPWTEGVIRPLAEAVGRHLGVPVEFRGPFGLKSRFYLGAEGIGAMELVWMGPEAGIGRTDYAKDTGEYRAGSIGFWNGLNHPDTLLPETMTVAELAQLLLADAGGMHAEEGREARKREPGQVPASS